MEDTAVVKPSAFELRLLNEFQHDFPLSPAPFAELAARLESSENLVIARLQELYRQGKISRIGAVFAPKRIGASTLAALAVPPERLDAVAQAINRFPEVNHNYEREHRYNLWFVVTAGSEERLAAALAAIEKTAGLPILRLPLVQEFHIDLGFSLAGGKKRPAGRAQDFTAPRPLEELERRLVMALQEGLPFFIRPFQALAERVGCDEFEVIKRIRGWCDEGIIKRFGVVVRHHELGYRANAMLVHDIPDADVERVGKFFAQAEGITLCYRRPRVLPDWPYNLFCMIHGQERAVVKARIATLRRAAAIEHHPHALLFSRTRYKQTGARYA